MRLDVLVILARAAISRGLSRESGCVRWLLVWGLEVLRPWRSCVMLRSMTRLRGSVASRRYPTIEIPPFFPFTRGYLIFI